MTGGDGDLGRAGQRVRPDARLHRHQRRQRAVLRPARRGRRRHAHLHAGRERQRLGHRERLASRRRGHRQRWRDTSPVQTFTITVTPVNDAPVASDDYDVDRGGHRQGRHACSPTTPTSMATPSPSTGVTDPATASVDRQRRRHHHLHAGRQLQRRRLASTTRSPTARSDGDTGTVSVTVTPVNDAPVANADSYIDG